MPVSRREGAPTALLVLATIADTAGASTVAFYLLLAVIPCIVVAGLGTLEEHLEDGAAPFRRLACGLYALMLVLVLIADALRAPLREEGTVPPFAVSAVVACIVLCAAQYGLRMLPLLRTLPLSRWRQALAPSLVSRR